MLSFDRSSRFCQKFCLVQNSCVTGPFVSHIKIIKIALRYNTNVVSVLSVALENNKTHQLLVLQSK